MQPFPPSWIVVLLFHICTDRDNAVTAKLLNTIVQKNEPCLKIIALFCLVRCGTTKRSKISSYMLLTQDQESCKGSTNSWRVTCVIRTFHCSRRRRRAYFASCCLAFLLSRSFFCRFLCSRSSFCRFLCSRSCFCRSSCRSCCRFFRSSFCSGRL